MHRPIRCLAAVALILATWNERSAAQNDAAPDSIFLNGPVVTMAGPDAIAEAVAVKQDRIAAVGSQQDIHKLAGPGTKTIDLEGKTLAPGFYAAHDHFPSWG